MSSATLPSRRGASVGTPRCANQYLIYKVKSLIQQSLDGRQLAQAHLRDDDNSTSKQNFSAYHSAAY